MNYRPSISEVSVKCRSSICEVSVKYRWSTGEVSVMHRSSIGHVSVKYQSWIGRVSVKCRSSIGQVSVKYRSSVSQVSVKYRSSVSQVSVMYRSSIGQVSVEYRWFKTISVDTFIGRLSADSKNFFWDHFLKELRHQAQLGNQAFWWREQFFTHHPRLVEVYLEGDREGNIFVTCVGKKQMRSYLLPFFCCCNFPEKTNGKLSITFFCVIFAGNNITLSRSAPYIYESSAFG